MSHEPIKILCDQCEINKLIDSGSLEMNENGECLCDCCGQPLTVIEDLNSIEVVTFMHEHLQNAKYFDIDLLPSILFEKIKNEFSFDETQQQTLSRILNEIFSVFYY